MGRLSNRCIGQPLRQAGGGNKTFCHQLYFYVCNEVVFLTSFPLAFVR